ncbi:MAG: hypothetical protein FWB72_03215 [Firmicutes bacterium]|nr:hypothetical protein [Bacillota bacterium]
MANAILLNKAVVDGTYTSLPLEIDSNILSTTIVAGLTVVKTASALIWVGGNLTYTVTISNLTDEDFVTPTLTDTLDITQIDLVANTVKIDGVTSAYTYSSVTGLLTVVLPTVVSGATTVVTFDVELV